jgi:protein SCO1/2
MQRVRRRVPAAAASLAAAALALVIAATFNSATASAQHAQWGAGYFPNVTLTTHQGKTVRFYDDLIKGKIIALDLIYTTCQYACPLETARLAQVQRILGDRVGRDIFFYSISIDPEHDTPAVLKEYAAKYHAGPGWLFLTGKAADIELISKKLGLYSEPNPANPDGHTPSVLVGNERTGQWMRNSALDNPGFLARTIGDWLDSWQSGSKRALRSFAEVPLRTFDEGQYSFRNHCAACHTIGGGETIGPDLVGVTARRDPEWLKRFIATPDRLFAEHDPVADALLAKYDQVRMPNLSLTQRDAAVLIDYIARQSADATAGTSAGAAAVGTPGTVADSRRLRGGGDPAGSAVARNATVRDVQALIEPYLRIQEALAVDSLDHVTDNAQAIATETAKIGSPAAAIRVAVNPFAQVADLTAAREAFAVLSDAVITYVRTVEATLDGAVTLAYCPMVHKSWLQRGDQVANPFYGKAMADCGRVVPGPLNAKNE